MRLNAGCSFAATLQFLQPEDHPANLLDVASSGAGNDYISASVIDAVIQHRKGIEYAFILWSGVSRVSLELGDDLRMHTKTPCGHFDSVNSWLHSGGFTGAYNEDPGLYDWQRDYFKQIYLTGYDEFFTNRTIRSIEAAKAMLECYNIPYDMGMIYDPLKHGYKHEGILGIATQDLSKYFTVGTYTLEWCRENDMLDQYGFHPTVHGYIAWLKHEGVWEKLQ